jgi:hypothetical protein
VIPVLLLGRFVVLAALVLAAALVLWLAATAE